MVNWLSKVKKVGQTINPASYTLTSRADLDRLYKDNQTLEKQYIDQISRPSMAQPYVSTDTGAKLAIYPFPLTMIQELAKNVDALRIPIETLQREIFKNGFEVKPKFQFKCNNCEKEFDRKPIKIDADKIFSDLKNTTKSTTGEDLSGNKKHTEKLECDECKGTEFRTPNPKNRTKLKNLYEKPINGNRQTMKEVGQQLERDLDEVDNAYLLILKNYYIDPTKREIDWERTKISEFLRINPAQVGMIADSDGRIGYDDNGNKIYVCPEYAHRTKRLTQPYCDSCGTRALEAEVEVNSVYSVGIPQPKRIVYGKGEVLWKPGKYVPDLVYGFSPIYAIWSKAMALSHMDEYIRKYFDKMRPPKGMLIIASRNYETFKKGWDALETAATEDPYRIHPMLVEGERANAKNAANWIDFTGSLKELEFIEIRKELRQIIGAIYGVLPLYYGELPSGWTQEGLQVTITNRAVKWGQDILYEGFFKDIAYLLGVDDWELRLKTGEETDELRDHQIKGVEIDNMVKLSNDLAFDVTIDGNGKFITSDKPNPEKLNALVDNRMNDRGDPSKSTKPKKDQTTSFQGEPKKVRNSDIGGGGQGSPTSGSGTSLSKKSLDVLNESNFEDVKSIINNGINKQWTMTHISKEISKQTDISLPAAEELLFTIFKASTTQIKPGNVFNVEGDTVE